MTAHDPAESTLPIPKVAVVVHGKPGGIESIRARGLAGGHPENRLSWHFRTEPRRGTAHRWRQELASASPDVIYLHNTAMPGAWVVPWHAWRCRIPYVLDTGDAVYEMARRSGVGGGLKLPALWFFERLLQRRASAIVVRGTRHKEYLESLGHPVVQLIRDGYAGQTSATPGQVERVREQLGIGSEFVVGVMGSLVRSPKLGICYGWDLIEAMPLLRDRPVRAMIIGDGDGLEGLRQRAGVLGVLDRVLFCGRIPYEDVPTYLRVMDIALSTQTNNLPGQVRTTGKLPEYMAAGRFILASRVGEAALLLPDPMLLDYEGEVDANYPSRLAARIREVESRPEWLRLRESLPEKALNLCDYAVLSRQWSRLVADVASRQARRLPESH